MINEQFVMSINRRPRDVIFIYLFIYSFDLFINLHNFYFRFSISFSYDVNFHDLKCISDFRKRNKSSAWKIPALFLIAKLLSRGKVDVLAGFIMPDYHKLDRLNITETSSHGW